MTIIYNYDPKYHNIFIYDEEPGFLGSRPITGGGINPGQGGTINKQLIPVRRNPSFIGGSDFDLSGVNYTFARPWFNSVTPHGQKIRDDDGIPLKDSTKLQEIFSQPTGWTGMNTMLSQYPLGFLITRKHLLVPTLAMGLWNSSEPKLMYDHPDKPYGSDGTVVDKVFFMDTAGVTYEMSVTDSNLDDGIINGVFEIPSQTPGGGGGWVPDKRGWTVLQFDQELPVGYTYYNKIIATETLPEGSDVLIVFTNNKAIRASYNGDTFEDFVKNIKSNPIFTRSIPNDSTSLPDYGLVFVRHKLFGTCLYHKTFEWNSFTQTDLQAPIEELSGSGYSTIQQFPSFFGIVQGLPDFEPIDLLTGSIANLIETSPSYSNSDKYTPPSKNPYYPITYSTKATNVQGISITADAENSVVGDGSGFDYQAIPSFTFHIYPPTAKENKSNEISQNNSDEDLKIYAYGGSGPVEEIRDDIVVGSTFSNSMIQAEFDFSPYMQFPNPKDFVDFKYRLDVYVNGIKHDYFTGRSDIPLTDYARRQTPFIPKDLFINAKSAGGYFTYPLSQNQELPKYYFDFKWIKNFSHDQAGGNIAVRLRYNGIDGSNFDTGAVDVGLIETNILSIPTYDGITPTLDTSIELPPPTTPEFSEFTFSFDNLTASPDIVPGNEETNTGSFLSVFINKQNPESENESETVLLERIPLSSISDMSSVTLSIPNTFEFPLSGNTSTIESTLYLAYEIEHPAYTITEIDSVIPEPLQNLIDSKSIVFEWQIIEEESEVIPRTTQPILFLSHFGGSDLGPLPSHSADGGNSFAGGAKFQDSNIDSNQITRSFFEAGTPKNTTARRISMTRTVEDDGYLVEYDSANNFTDKTSLHASRSLDGVQYIINNYFEPAYQIGYRRFLYWTPAGNIAGGHDILPKDHVDNTLLKNDKWMNTTSSTISNGFWQGRGQFASASWTALDRKNPNGTPIVLTDAWAREMEDMGYYNPITTGYSSPWTTNGYPVEWFESGGEFAFGWNTQGEGPVNWRSKDGQEVRNRQDSWKTYMKDWIQSKKEQGDPVDVFIYNGGIVPYKSIDGADEDNQNGGDPSDIEWGSVGHIKWDQSSGQQFEGWISDVGLSTNDVFTNERFTSLHPHKKYVQPRIEADGKTWKSQGDKEFYEKNYLPWKSEVGVNGFWIDATGDMLKTNPGQKFWFDNNDLYVGTEGLGWEKTNEAASTGRNRWFPPPEAVQMPYLALVENGSAYAETRGWQNFNWKTGQMFHPRQDLGGMPIEGGGFTQISSFQDQLTIAAATPGTGNPVPLRFSDGTLYDPSTPPELYLWLRWGNGNPESTTSGWAAKHRLRDNEGNLIKRTSGPYETLTFEPTETNPQTFDRNLFDGIEQNIYGESLARYYNEDSMKREIDEMIDKGYIPSNNLGAANQFNPDGVVRNNGASVTDYNIFARIQKYINARLDGLSADDPEATKWLFTEIYDGSPNVPRMFIDFEPDVVDLSETTSLDINVSGDFTDGNLIVKWGIE